MLPFRPWAALGEVGRRKWEYVTSPLAIIDLLAILPSYRPVRLLRVFLLFRLFKLFRYARSVHGMAEVLWEHRFEFFTLAIRRFGAGRRQGAIGGQEQVGINAGTPFIHPEPHRGGEPRH